ncbi:MAG: putative sporulation protein polysaccharide deacetylase family [Acidimicrobiaceae bacterium]|nr:putative sporulation protein polysaccharide deacetylase family [Acidimicrobiaceae bacterium]
MERPFGDFQAAVSLSFDDGRPSQLDNGLALLDSAGVRATFYVLPDAVAERAEQWRALRDSRHEIGNHSLTHPCSGNFGFSRKNALENHSLESVAADIEQASEQLQGLFGAAPSTFAYPCGQSFVGRGRSRASYVPLVAERFLAGRGYGSETANDPLRCDLAHLEAVVMDGLDLQALGALLEAARAEGSWLVLAGHDIGDPGYQHVATAALDPFLALLTRTDDVLVAPVGEVAALLTAAR